MKYQELTMHLKDLLTLLREKIESTEFIEHFSPSLKPVIGNWSDETNLPMPVTGDGVGNKSGIYFITKEDNEILYIGKATKNNLHDRIWDHMQTPKEQDGWRTFPKNKFSTGRLDGNLRLVEDGMVKIGVIEISPPEVTSLVEVYLQTIYSLRANGALPPFCKQIG